MKDQYFLDFPDDSLMKNRVLSLLRKGRNLIFPDVIAIEKVLLHKMKSVD